MSYVPSNDIAIMAREGFQWNAWERIIRDNGIVIDRASGRPHPKFSDIVYPIDYGYVRGTVSSDHDELDIFVGSGRDGLAGCILTSDFRRGDQEVKFIYNCSPREIYLINGFINYDTTLMMGRLVLRRPMHELW